MPVNYNSKRPYESTDLADLYRSCRIELKSDSQAWVMAEMVMEIRRVACEWFKAMEDDSAWGRRPDPRGKMVSKEEADRIVMTMEDDFNVERPRWLNYGVTDGPGFTRLHDSNRLAFAQEISAALKSENEIKQEVERRLQAGEKLPPGDIPEGWPY